MAYTTIDDPSAYFQTALWSGNDSTQSIVNDGNSDMQPDLVWIKRRDGAAINHQAYDSSRGATKNLVPNETQAEGTRSTGLTSFDSDGFSLGAGGAENSAGNTFVGWQWKANGGTTASNTSGDITTTVQANTTAGFSIFTYTGTGTAGDTIGHGLGAVPNWIWIKARNIANDQTIYHSANTSAPETEFLILQGTDATSDSNTRWNDIAPTSTLITLGNNAGVNGSTQTYVGYAFAEKQGYSKFGSYTGNANADGPFVYTGFKPAWIMLKSTTSAEVWSMRDNKRDSFNSAQKAIYANSNGAESDNVNNSIDLLSNGFKLRNQFGTENTSGGTFIYMAFAEHPFVSSEGVPTTAR